MHVIAIKCHEYELDLMQSLAKIRKALSEGIVIIQIIENAINIEDNEDC